MKIAISWGFHFLKRCGWKNLLVKKVHLLTIVMHRFMDAEDVKEAVKWNKRGEWSPQEKIRETQERLQACNYSMAHPDQQELVPACVQHSILDENINQQAREKIGST